MKPARHKPASAVPEHHRTLRAQPLPVERIRAAYEVVRRSAKLPKRYPGPTQTPAQMTAHAPRDISPDTVAMRTNEWFRALVATGPNQSAPHTATAETISQGLNRLRDFAAAGDAAAMRCYGRIIAEAVSDLSELARMHPEHVQAWSAVLPVVPVLTGRNRGHKSDLAADLDAFAVGQDSPVKINPQAKRGGAGFNARTPGIFLAGALIDCMNQHSKALAFYPEPVPPWLRLFCALESAGPATAAQWADAAWEYLLDGTDGKPEAFFWDLGKGKATAAGGGKRTAASNVRAEIRQTLREAIARMMR